MRYVITFLVGLLLGGVAIVFFLGTPRAKSAPGTRIEAPAAGAQSPATVVVTVPNSFFDQVLGAIFHDLSPPSFQLTQTSPRNPTIERVAFQSGCNNNITILPEGSGVQTKVEFAGGKISVPLAFSGTYNLLGNCMQFKGWAQTTIQLRFEQSSQNVYGQLIVEGVTLEGVNPLANNFVTVFVRDAIDSRVNPLEIIRGQQLQLAIPVKASNGTVNARVKDVRAEVSDGALKMHITYEFGGARATN